MADFIGEERTGKERRGEERARKGEEQPAKSRNTEYLSWDGEATKKSPLPIDSVIIASESIPKESINVSKSTLQMSLMDSGDVAAPLSNGLGSYEVTPQNVQTTSFGTVKLSSTTYSTQSILDDGSLVDANGIQYDGLVDDVLLEVEDNDQIDDELHNTVGSAHRQSNTIGTQNATLSASVPPLGSRAPPPPPRSIVSPATPETTPRGRKSFYNFIPSEHTIEQPDEDDDLILTCSDFIASPPIADMTSQSLPPAGYPVAGFDGPNLRGDTLDNVLDWRSQKCGLPEIPQSVLEFGAGKVFVVARVRPQTAMEMAEGGTYNVDVLPDNATIVVGGSPGVSRDTEYTLHKILDADATQEEAYLAVAHPIVEGALYGFNGTIFAYGQTSSGKTYTTFGAHGVEGDGSVDELSAGLLQHNDGRGIIPRSIETIFDALRKLPSDVSVAVQVSMVEIYIDRIRDLLVTRTADGAAMPQQQSRNVASSASAATTVALPVSGVSNMLSPPPITRSTSPRPSSRSSSPRPSSRSSSPRASQQWPTSPKFAPLRSPAAVASAKLYGEEDPDNLNVIHDPTFGAQLTGATTLTVNSEKELLDVLRIGAVNRQVAATNMNEVSSRSHCIVIVSILQESPYGVQEDAALSASDGVPVENPTTRYSKLYFVDLAGSERPAKSKVVGMQLQEAQSINVSLSTLGTVINALANNATHIPYRDNKLTRLLQDGLGNNSRTSLVINVSPSSYNSEETKSSLRFGAAAVRVRTKAFINTLNAHDLARKGALERLQRAKSYSSFVRDNRKSEAISKAREKAKRQSIMQQKMKNLRLTNPDDAFVTPAPSNVVIPETSISPRASFQAEGDGMHTTASSPGRERTERPSSSPDALKALLRHPSAHALLGSPVHQYLKALAHEISQQEHAAQEEADLQNALNDPHKDLFDNPAMGDMAVREVYLLEELDVCVSTSSDRSRSSDNGWMARDQQRSPLPTIMDEDEDEDSAGLAGDSPPDRPKRASRRESAPRRSLSMSNLRGARSSVSSLPPLPLAQPRVLTPCQIYTVTLTQAPLGFRFFDPDVATHILPLLPSLSRTKLPPQNGGGLHVLASADSKPLNAAALLPVVESVLPGYPADVLRADGSGCVAYPDHRAAGSDAEASDEDAGPSTSEERSRGWESRGAIAIGDRLLAVNGIRLDLLPVSFEPQLPENAVPATLDLDADDKQMAAKYAEATNRAVKLVKYAMQAMKRGTSFIAHPRSPSMSSDSASLPDVSEFGEQFQGADISKANVCTLTFVSAGPFVRRGIIVGLKLALHHEAHMKKMHDTIVATGPSLSSAAPEEVVTPSSPKSPRGAVSLAPPTDVAPEAADNTQVQVGKVNDPVSGGVSPASPASPASPKVPLETSASISDLPSPRPSNSNVKKVPEAARPGCFACFALK